MLSFHLLPNDKELVIESPKKGDKNYTLIHKTVNAGV